ncbi:exosome complex component rrp43 [Protomyces lactucae-debilis]|uniref:Ribosomal RNA-processing protein 43 n=1 Tax=Protomyces lactucae-debilis TaxID=2754530 RepID=A0A1Y2FSM2_PROLT|nr:exosome complex component rrp43 [Protomyces lactucae-debilis]ORY86978.1 exosome complex component rrp43 [Protomyces lactucae-debilis]
MAELKPLTFPPELYKRLVPAQFLAQHLEASPPVRPSGRQLTDFRDVSITSSSLSNTAGSAVVRHGETVMVCGIRAEIAEPSVTEPSIGYLVPNIEIGPLCSSKYKAGPPSELQQSIAHQLSTFLKDCGIVDLGDLCIESGKAVWCLYIDIICLSSSAAHFSASALAMVSALLNTSLPEAVWDLELNDVRCREVFVPLKVNSVPFVIEFGVFKAKILADPDGDESDLCAESLTVVMTASGDIYGVRKTGGPLLQGSAMQEVLSVTEKRVQQLESIIKNAGRNHRL